MMNCSSDMRCFAVVILLLNVPCAFSPITHEIVYVAGCFMNGATEVQFEFDAEEILHVDFQREEVVYTVPKFVTLDPSQIFEGMNVIKDARVNKGVCLVSTADFAYEERYPPEKKDPPESVLYPSEEVQLGVENSLVCFVNRFYPPSISVIWTKNGQVVSEGVSLSRYYPSNNQPLTFHQFSTLTFTPKQDDVYSCTVEHSALERPKTRIWEVELSRPSHGLDIFCGVGLTVALLGVATGTFFIVKRRHGQNISTPYVDYIDNGLL